MLLSFPFSPGVPTHNPLESLPILVFFARLWLKRAFPTYNESWTLETCPLQSRTKTQPLLYSRKFIFRGKMGQSGDIFRNQNQPAPIWMSVCVRIMAVPLPSIYSQTPYKDIHIALVGRAGRPDQTKPPPIQPDRVHLLYHPAFGPELPVCPAPPHPAPDPHPGIVVHIHTHYLSRASCHYRSHRCSWMWG